MATPPCHPPWGPLFAAEYATEVSVKRASQMGAMAGRQWVSCNSTVRPARKCSVTAASFASVFGEWGCAIHLTFQEHTVPSADRSAAAATRAKMSPRVTPSARCPHVGLAGLAADPRARAHSAVTERTRKRSWPGKARA
eukprot:2546664-Alexandrium_andersonii.AAC.1